MKPLMQLKAEDTVGEVPEHEEDGKEEWSSAWDDVNHKILDPNLVKAARAEEMKYINDKRVWTKMNKEDTIKKGYKIVDTRWIDTDKGDETRPNYRSRLVGKEFNTGAEDGLFASTPPLEARDFGPR